MVKDSSDNNNIPGFVVPLRGSGNLGSNSSPFVGRSPGYGVPSSRFGQILEEYNSPNSRIKMLTEFASRTFKGGSINLNVSLGSKKNPNDEEPNNGSGYKPPKPPRGKRKLNSENSKEVPYYGLTRRPNSTPYFSTGVDVGLVPVFEPDGNNDYTPMIISCGEMFPFEFKTSPTNRNFIDNVTRNSIFIEYQDIVNSKSNFSVYNKFYIEDFYKYMNIVCKSLQIYYSIDSTLTIFENSSINNRGISHLRNKMTSEVISNFTILQREIEKQVICPETVKFVAFMFQNFIVDNDMNSTIVRLGYNNLFREKTNGTYDGSLDSDLIMKTIEELQKQDFGRIRSVLLKCCPEFKIITLIPSSNVPIYDKEFLTFWYNQNLCYYQNDKKNKPSYTKTLIKQIDNIYIGSYVDDLDSAFYCLLGFNVLGGEEGEDDLLFNGIWRPNSDMSYEQDNYTNLLRFSESNFKGEWSILNFTLSGVSSVPVYDGGYNGLEVYSNRSNVPKYYMYSTVSMLSQALKVTVPKLLSYRRS
jgi:hypothetical protein